MAVVMVTFHGKIVCLVIHGGETVKLRFQVVEKELKPSDDSIALLKSLSRCSHYKTLDTTNVYGYKTSPYGESK